MKQISVLLFVYLFFAPAFGRAQPELTSLVSAPSGRSPGRPGVMDEAELQNCCKKMEKDHRRIYYLVNRGFRMNLQVKGIYIREGLLFFRLALSNHSHLDYDVDSIRFFMKDSRATKKNAPAIHPLASLYCYGNTRLIRGKSREESVIVLQRFTLPADKRLVIEVSEKNGGRRLQLFVDNFTLLRSRLI